MESLVMKSSIMVMWIEWKIRMIVVIMIVKSMGV